LHCIEVTINKLKLSTANMCTKTSDSKDRP